MKKCKIMISSLLLMSMPMMNLNAWALDNLNQNVGAQDENIQVNINQNEIRNRYINEIRNNLWRLKHLPKDLKTLYKYYKLVKVLFSFAPDLYHKFIFEKPVNVDEAIASLEAGLDQLIGQEKQKEKIVTTIDGILGRNELMGKDEKGHVLYLVGPSGVGKTCAAEIISEALNNSKKKFIINPASVGFNSNEKGRKPVTVEQLFGLKSSMLDLFLDEGKSQDSLIDYIENTKLPVIIINEYDKMWSRDLDEIFRAIVDDGKITVSGKEMDFSGAIFIITSNESHCSVADCNSEELDKDNTGSRTQIQHDQSFMNRIPVIEFGDLSKEDYKIIAKNRFQEIADKFEKQHKIKVDIDGMLNGAAEQAVKLGKGSRPITNDMVNSLVDILNQKRRECQKNEIVVQSFKVCCDAQGGKISITGLGFDKNKKVIEIGESALDVSFIEDSGSSDESHVVAPTEPDGDEEEIVDLNNIDFPMVLNYVLQ